MSTSYRQARRAVDAVQDEKGLQPKKKNPVPASRSTRYANPRKRKMDAANALTGDVLLPGQG